MSSANGYALRPGIVLVLASLAVLAIGLPSHAIVQQAGTECSRWDQTQCSPLNGAVSTGQVVNLHASTSANRVHTGDVIDKSLSAPS